MEEKPFYYDPHDDGKPEQKKSKQISVPVILIDIIIMLFATAIFAGIIYAALHFFGAL